MHAAVLVGRCDMSANTTGFEPLMDRHGLSRVDEKGAYVDVGGKSPAWVPLQEMSSFKVESVSVSLHRWRTLEVVFALTS